MCTLIPLGIVFIICYFTYSAMRNKTRLAEKAIDSGCSSDDMEQIRQLTRKGRPSKSIKASLLRRVVWGTLLAISGAGVIISDLTLARHPKAMIVIIGAVVFALGAGLLASYFSGKTLYADRIAMEEQEEKAAHSARLEKIEMQRRRAVRQNDPNRQKSDL